MIEIELTGNGTKKDKFMSCVEEQDPSHDFKAFKMIYKLGNKTGLFHLRIFQYENELSVSNIDIGPDITKVIFRLVTK